MGEPQTFTIGAATRGQTFTIDSPTRGMRYRQQAQTFTIDAHFVGRKTEKKMVETTLGPPFTIADQRLDLVNSEYSESRTPSIYNIYYTLHKYSTIH